MDLPQRKRNRLPMFDYSSVGAYFLTICTQDKQNTLSAIVGGGALDAPQSRLTKTGQIVAQCILSSNQIPGLFVDKYAIMPNHIHMIVFVHKAPGAVSSSPANAKIPHFISSRKRLCHKAAGFQIFQRSYHDHVIRGDRDYQRIWQYIDTNPARWKEDCFYQE